MYKLRDSLLPLHRGASPPPLPIGRLEESLTELATQSIEPGPSHWVPVLVYLFFHSSEQSRGQSEKR